MHVADGEVAVDEVVDEVDKVAEVAFGLHQRSRLVDGRLHEGDAFVVQVEVEHALAGDVVELMLFQRQFVSMGYGLAFRAGLDAGVEVLVGFGNGAEQMQCGQPARVVVFAERGDGIAAVVFGKGVVFGEKVGDVGVHKGSFAGRQFAAKFAFADAPVGGIEVGGGQQHQRVGTVAAARGRGLRSGVAAAGDKEQQPQQKRKSWFFHCVLRK